ncbi:uncharacterized protein LOC122505075 isoform X2 [Leptopilina heterotoma]|nr:uncharacterized protein LOC122505075 isoform X2 [Leptopilina heterotoma]XP_043472433.1 uncharacterized protein LOC122505075 isoform X2 [Leptopilina heterotoma]
MESLKRKQENECLPPPASTKLPKTIQTEKVNLSDNVTKDSETVETSKFINKERNPLKIINNNKLISNTPTNSAPLVKVIKKKENFKNIISGKLSKKNQNSSSAMLVKKTNVKVTSKGIDITEKGQRTTLKNLMSPQITKQKSTSIGKLSPVNGTCSSSLIPVSSNESEIVFRHDQDYQDDQNLDSSIAKESNFEKCMNVEKEEREAQNALKEKDKIAVGKLSQVNGAGSSSLIPVPSSESEIVFRDDQNSQDAQNMDRPDAKESNSKKYMNVEKTERGAQNALKEKDKIAVVKLSQVNEATLKKILSRFDYFLTTFLSSISPQR